MRSTSGFVCTKSQSGIRVRGVDMFRFKRNRFMHILIKLSMPTNVIFTRISILELFSL
jgi:hypothetical protein